MISMYLSFASCYILILSSVFLPVVMSYKIRMPLNPSAIFVQFQFQFPFSSEIAQKTEERCVKFPSEISIKFLVFVYAWVVKSFMKRFSSPIRRHSICKCNTNVYRCMAQGLCWKIVGSNMVHAAHDELKTSDLEQIFVGKTICMHTNYCEFVDAFTTRQTGVAQRKQITRSTRQREEEEKKIFQIESSHII